MPVIECGLLFAVVVVVVVVEPVPVIGVGCCLLHVVVVVVVVVVEPVPVIGCGLLLPVIVLRAVAGGLGAGDMFSKVHPYCLHPYFHFLLSGCLGHPPDQTF